MVTITQAQQLLRVIQDEVQLVKQQIAKSQLVTARIKENEHNIDLDVIQRTPSRQNKIINAVQNNNIQQQQTIQQSPQVCHVAEIMQSNVSTCKCGPLLHLVRKSVFFGNEQWVVHNFLVDKQHGINWYEFRQQHSNSVSSDTECNCEQLMRATPLGHVPFWCVTYNSRGSRFKRACVCWPVIFAQDYPSLQESKIASNINLSHLFVASQKQLKLAQISTQISDARKRKQSQLPNLYCFAIQYYKQSKHAYEMIVLATFDSQTRREWVQFLSQYMDWYILPGREALIRVEGMRRMCNTPLHRSAVIDGEAPRSPS